jgi:hypothetical protein
MPKSYLPLAIALTLGLAACSDKQTTQLQQSASDAIGAVHSTVEAASAPVGELKQEASAALGTAAIKVGSAAAALKPELKQQMDKLKQQASAVKQAVKGLQDH